jgi:hypothetical protein
MNRKKFILLTTVVASMYVGLYLILTLTGQYLLVKAKPQDMLYEPDGTAYDVEVWCPLGMRFQNDYATDGHPRETCGNFPGYAFSPFILLDRKYFHVSIQIIKMIEPTRLELVEESGEQSSGGDSSPRPEAGVGTPQK